MSASQAAKRQVGTFAGSPGRMALLLGVLAGLMVIATLGDPGITVDEPLDVRPGRTYVEALRKYGWHFFDRRVVDQVFRDNAEHPSLGRWLLGLASTFGEPFEELLGGSDPFSVHSGRLAPAVCFAALVGLVTRFTGRRYGLAAGAGAGCALGLMPRLFAHAHFAALDTFLCFFWTLALLAAVKAAERPAPLGSMALAGLCWGLALLVKIHAWLLAPVVMVAALSRHRPARAAGAVAVWALAGWSLFFAGWPWLWYDTWSRLTAYLGTSTQRASLLVQYFGAVYADKDVPWHYPWLYFAVTVPVGLHALGAVGLVEAGRNRAQDKFPLLLLAVILEFLLLFSTRVPVYDGERLFLVVFPCWAILIGLGWRAVWRWAGSRVWLRAAAVAVLAGQGYGLAALHPFQLSYYNLLVGGLPGAERLGLELTYWGDTVDRTLLDELARHGEPGQSAALVPTLHDIQPTASMTAALVQRRVSLVPQQAAGKARWLVGYRRTAYWPAGLGARLNPGGAIATRSRQGVWLAGLWTQPPGTPERGP